MATSKGKSTQAAKESKLKARRKNRGGGETADWASMDAQVILDLIAAVTVHNTTIQFGYTPDGGAYVVSYYEFATGESERVFIRPTEDPEERIKDELEAWKF